jgi:hypothetical protein
MGKMQRPKFVIGIDPGAKGAIASYSTTFEPPGDARWAVEKLAEMPQDRFSQLEGYAEAATRLETPRIAILEDVGGFIGVPQPGSRMFAFGRGYGQLEGALIALGYQIIRLRPQAWQKILSLKSRPGESKPDHKRRMRGKALDLFPQLKPTLDQSDALLILYAFIVTGFILDINKEI